MDFLPSYKEVSLQLATGVQLAILIHMITVTADITISFKFFFHPMYGNFFENNTIATVGLINFEDKKFQGFRGYLLNLEIKYLRNFLHTRSRFNIHGG